MIQYSFTFCLLFSRPKKRQWTEEGHGVNLSVSSKSRHQEIRKITSVNLIYTGEELAHYGIMPKDPWKIKHCELFFFVTEKRGA